MGSPHVLESTFLFMNKHWSLHPHPNNPNIARESAVAQGNTAVCEHLLAGLRPPIFENSIKDLAAISLRLKLAIQEATMNGCVHIIDLIGAWTTRLLDAKFELTRDLEATVNCAIKTGSPRTLRALLRNSSFQANDESNFDYFRLAIDTDQPEMLRVLVDEGFPCNVSCDTRDDYALEFDEDDDHMLLSAFELAAEKDWPSEIEHMVAVSEKKLKDFEDTGHGTAGERRSDRNTQLWLAWLIALDVYGGPIEEDGEVLDGLTKPAWALLPVVAGFWTYPRECSWADADRDFF